MFKGVRYQTWNQTARSNFEDALVIAPHSREQRLNIVLENNYKRLQVDEIGGWDAEGAGVPLDVVPHDFAVWIVDQVRVGRVGSSPQILRLKI